MYFAMNFNDYQMKILASQMGTSLNMLQSRNVNDPRGTNFDVDELDKELAKTIKKK